MPAYFLFRRMVLQQRSVSIARVVRNLAGALTVALPLVAAATTAMAQTGLDGQVTELAPIDVRADRIQSSVERAIADRRAAPNATVVIDREELTQFNDLPIGDLLRRLPSVTFDGGNRAREPRLRGVAREYTQVLINGRRLLDGAASRTIQLDRLPSSIVERVEIIRSPLAETDGQGAAGTINIVLRNDIQDRISELGLGAGYFEGQGLIGDVNFLHADRAGRFSYTLLGSLQSPTRVESSDTFVFGPGGAPNRGTLGSNVRRYRQATFLPSFQYDLDNTSLFFQPSYLYTLEKRKDRQERLTVAQTAVDRIDEEKRRRVRETYGALFGVTHKVDAFKGTLAIDVQKAREDTTREAQRFQPPGTLVQERSRAEEIGLTRINPTFRFEADLPGHLFTAGFGYARDTRSEENSDAVNGVPAAPNYSRIYKIDEGILSGFVQDTMTLGNGRLTLGTRYEASRTRTRDAFDDSFVTTAGHFLPSLSYVHKLTEAIDFRAGVARTLRRPDLRELSPTVSTNAGTVANPDTGGNPELVPERIWGADVGIDHALYNGRGLLAANVFGRSIDERIEPVISFEGARAVRRPQNVGSGSFWGVELEGRVPLDALSLPQVSLWGNIAYIESRVYDPLLGKKRSFADQPNTVGTIGVDWFVQSLSTTFGVAANWRAATRWTQGLPADEKLDTRKSESLRLDVSARIELSPTASVTISGLNLLGKAERTTAERINAGGTVIATERDREPTYRTLYVASRFRF